MIIILISIVFIFAARPLEGETGQNTFEQLAACPGLAAGIRWHLPFIAYRFPGLLKNSLFTSTEAALAKIIESKV